MEGLFALLVIAGFFYYMMRTGCGAHMVHGGHMGHGDQDGHGALAAPAGPIAPAAKGRDPVCGMEVGPERGYSEVYQGNMYRFCSRDCLDKFDTQPQLYLSRKGVST